MAPVTSDPPGSPRKARPVSRKLVALAAIAVAGGILHITGMIGRTESEVSNIARSRFVKIRGIFLPNHAQQLRKRFAEWLDGGWGQNMVFHAHRVHLYDSDGPRILAERLAGDFHGKQYFPSVWPMLQAAGWEAKVMELVPRTAAQVAEAIMNMSTIQHVRLFPGLGWWFEWHIQGHRKMVHAPDGRGPRYLAEHVSGMWGGGKFDMDEVWPILVRQGFESRVLGLLEPVNAHDVADLIMTMTEQLKDLPPEEAGKWLAIYRQQGIRGLSDSLARDSRGEEFRHAVWRMLEGAGWTAQIEKLFKPMTAPEILGSVMSLASPEVVDVLPEDRRFQMRKTLYKKDGLKKLVLGTIMSLGGAKYASETWKLAVTADFEAQVKAVLKPPTPQELLGEWMPATNPEVAPHMPPVPLAQLRRATQEEGGFAKWIDSMLEDNAITDQRDEFEKALAASDFVAKIRNITAYHEPVGGLEKPGAAASASPPPADMSSWAPEQIVKHILEIATVDFIAKMPAHQAVEIRNVFVRDDYLHVLLSWLMMTSNMPIHHADEVERLLEAEGFEQRRRAFNRYFEQDDEL